MAQTEIGLAFEFIAFGQKLGRNQRAERSSLCPVFGLVSALRSLSSVALSSARVSMSLPCLFIHPWQRGHLYFAKKGTFLLCIDSNHHQFCLVSGKINGAAMKPDH